ncbi:RCC1 domain-containing protein, partial [Frondihabitans sp. 4ASC-45]
MNNEVLPKGSAFRAGLRSCRKPGQIAITAAVIAGLMFTGVSAATAAVQEGGVGGGATVQVAVNGMSFANIFGGAVGQSTFGITTDGTLYGWGLNTSGQLGIGTTTNAAVPTPVSTTGALAGKT